jgi:predicted TIM-barrel fold metal-dependent hydrolase
LAWPENSNLDYAHEKMVTDMDPEIDEQVLDGEKSLDSSRGRITKTQEKNRNESIEENLEKLAALNLSNDLSMQPRFSTAMIRLVSAAAGIGVLLLIYLVVKLFY